MISRRKATSQAGKQSCVQKEHHGQLFLHFCEHHGQLFLHFCEKINHENREQMSCIFQQELVVALNKKKRETFKFLQECLDWNSAIVTIRPTFMKWQK